MRTTERNKVKKRRVAESAYTGDSHYTKISQMAKLQWSPWSDLPRDLLHIIFKKLENPSDIYQCGIVCVSWKSVATAILANSHFILLPNRDSRVGDCVLLDTQTKGIHTLTLPELYHVKFLISSSFGWLLTVDKRYKVRLLNPFTREQIKLPSAINFFNRPGYFRVITSTNPLDPKCIVIVTYHSYREHNMACCRPGDWNWTVREISNCSGSDFIFYKGEFYSIDFYGKLFRICLRRGVVESSLPRLELRKTDVTYLVEVEGNLLLVVTSRCISRDPYECVVYKLDWIEKQWIRVRSIGNNSILLKYSNGKYSITVPVNHFINLRADCIYFLSYFSVKLFNMVTESVEEVYDPKDLQLDVPPWWKSVGDLLIPDLYVKNIPRSKWKQCFRCFFGCFFHH